MWFGKRSFVKLYEIKSYFNNIFEILSSEKQKVDNKLQKFRVKGKENTKN